MNNDNEAGPREDSPIGDVSWSFPERAGNTELGLKLLVDAGNVYTYGTHPERWAEIMTQMGRIYLQRRVGGHVKNLESAIHCFTEALKVYDQDSHPFEWAKCHCEMGEAIQRLSDGRDPALKERALRYFGLALGVITKADWPEMWHTIHMHISILHRKYALYSPTPGEDRALAEQHQRLALDLDRNRYPELYSVLRDLNDVYAKILAEEWGNREFSVGMSLLDEPSVDHERALVALENARNVYAIEVDPLRWARISMELGFIYRTRRIGGVSENLEKAIQFYSDAITVYQRDTHPLEWGRCQSEMGEAIQRLSDGRDPALKERALRYFGLALGVITKADWPEMWHTIHMHISMLHRKYALYSPTPGEDRALAEQHQRLALDLDRNRYPELYSMMIRTFALSEQILGLRCKLQSIESAEGGVSEPAGPNRNTPKLL